MIRAHKVLLSLSLLLGIIPAQPDSARHAVQIGFDRGLSLRGYPAEKPIGIGLVLYPTNNRGLLYENSEHKRASSDEDYSYGTEGDTRIKGFGLFLEGLYDFQFGKHFSLTPFASVGGEYNYINSKYNSAYTFSDSAGNPDTRTDRFHTETTAKVLQGRIGVMPGVTIGRFAVQYRLGFGAEISFTESPEELKRRKDGESTEAYLVYPADLVQSLIVHFGIF